MREQANDETNFQFSCFTSSFPSSARSILLVCCQAVMNTFFHASCLSPPLRPSKKLFKSVRRMDIVGALKDFATIEGTRDKTNHKKANKPTCYQEVSSWHNICYVHFVLLEQFFQQVLHLEVARLLRSLVEFLDQFRRVTLQATMPIRRVAEIDLLWTCLAWEWMDDDKGREDWMFDKFELKMGLWRLCWWDVYFIGYVWPLKAFLMP